MFSFWMDIFHDVSRPRKKTTITCVSKFADDKRKKFLPEQFHHLQKNPLSLVKLGAVVQMWK